MSRELSDPYDPAHVDLAAERALQVLSGGPKAIPMQRLARFSHAEIPVMQLALKKLLAEGKIDFDLATLHYRKVWK